LVDCAQDILEELKDLPAVDWHTASAPDLLNPRRALEPFLENEQIGSSTLRVLDYLGQDPVGLDELQIRSGLSTSQLQAELFQLELNGALGRLQGGLYQKLSPRR
jgi:DNA processing protein